MPANWCLSNFQFKMSKDFKVESQFDGHKNDFNIFLIEHSEHWLLTTSADYL